MVYTVQNSDLMNSQQLVILGVEGCFLAFVAIGYMWYLSQTVGDSCVRWWCASTSRVEWYCSVACPPKSAFTPGEEGGTMPSHQGGSALAPSQGHQDNNDNNKALGRGIEGGGWGWPGTPGTKPQQAQKASGKPGKVCKATDTAPSPTLPAQ